MGYLKRRRSRMRDADAFREAFPDDVDFNELEWAFAPQWTAEQRAGSTQSYVRFAVRERGVPAKAYWGTFHAAYRIVKQPVAPDDLDRAALVAELGALLAWFEKHLKPHRPRQRPARFWFFATAAECLDRMWEMTRLIERAGYVVLVRETDDPGKIIYRDAFQVAAVPARTDGLQRGVSRGGRRV